MDENSWRKEIEMKKYLLMICMVVIALSLAACGGDESGASDGGDSASGAKSSGSPIFSGEALKFFGLEGEDAFELLGDGGTTGDMRYMTNTKNGMEVILSNTAADMDTYRVNEVRISGDSKISFNGLKLGDSLKDADKKLMKDGEYQMGLLWKTTIDGKPFRVQLSTEDDKTISAIDATLTEDLGNGENETPDLNNSFSYQEDPHDLEPGYWE